MAERDAKGRFVKKKSGNPLGRPKGSKNAITLMKLMAEQAVRERNTDKMLEVANLVIEQALSGDSKSQKLVWDAVMSKSSADDKTQAKEKVEIKIGTMDTPQVTKVSEIVIDNEDN